MSTCLARSCLQKRKDDAELKPDLHSFEEKVLQRLTARCSILKTLL